MFSYQHFMPFGSSGTYHRGVEARDLGVINLTTLVLLFITGWDESNYSLWISGCFHIRQAFSPSTWRHQPHESKYCCHNKVLGIRKIITFTTNSSQLLNLIIWLTIETNKTHNLSPLVVFTVLLQHETIYREGCHRVEEGKDTNGDKELCWGGVVPGQK